MCHYFKPSLCANQRSGAGRGKREEEDALEEDANSRERRRLQPELEGGALKWSFDSSTSLPSGLPSFARLFACIPPYLAR